MKRYLPIIILAGIIAVSAPFIRPAKADQHRQGLPAAAVIFSAYEKYENGEPVGYFVYLSQSSPNAPKIEVESEVAADLEMLLAQGFQLQSSDSFVFRLIRPARTTMD